MAHGQDDRIGLQRAAVGQREREAAFRPAVDGIDPCGDDAQPVCVSGRGRAQPAFKIFAVQHARHEGARAVAVAIVFEVADEIAFLRQVHAEAAGRYVEQVQRRTGAVGQPAGNRPGCVDQMNLPVIAGVIAAAGKQLTGAGGAAETGTDDDERAHAYPFRLNGRRAARTG